MAPAKSRIGVEEGFGGDDRGGEAALHVAGAAAVDLAVAQLAAERIGGPAGADLDHVVVRVEVDGVAGRRALAAGDEVPARMLVAVAGRALGAEQLDGEAARRQAVADVLADREVVVAGRVDRRDADEVLGQRDEVVAAVGDGGAEFFAEVGGHGAEAAVLRVNCGHSSHLGGGSAERW